MDGIVINNLVIMIMTTVYGDNKCYCNKVLKIVMKVSDGNGNDNSCYGTVLSILRRLVFSWYWW